jgi:hypothetical protein
VKKYYFREEKLRYDERNVESVLLMKRKWYSWKRNISVCIVFHYHLSHETLRMIFSHTPHLTEVRNGNEEMMEASNDVVFVTHEYLCCLLMFPCSPVQVLFNAVILSVCSIIPHLPVWETVENWMGVRPLLLLPCCPTMLRRLAAAVLLRGDGDEA